jgi:hypothetical protein
MYGMLIVDPPDPTGQLPAPYRTGGPGYARANLRAANSELPSWADSLENKDFAVRYDREAIWVPDEFDSEWHELSHTAFQQACNRNDPMAADTFTRNGILNNFRPDVFVISGVVSVPGVPITDPRVAVNAQFGETILIRLLNAGYTTHEYTLDLDAIVTSTDGNPFGVPPANIYSRPFLIPAGTPFRLTTARRIEMLVRPPRTGRFPMRVKYYDWVHGPEKGANQRLYHTAETAIVVQ